MGPMADPSCEHLASIVVDVAPSSDGCIDCMAIGTVWVHLRRCVTCGHVGCCDSSQMRHATAHVGTSGHPVVQSYEPGEDWLWCYVDQVMFELDDLADSPSHS
jgi:hypothetical protein